MLHTNITDKFPIVAAVSCIKKVNNLAPLATSQQGLERVSATQSAHCGVPPSVCLRPKRALVPEMPGKPK